MSFQIGGSGNTYYKGSSMIAIHDRANGTGGGTNFYVAGAGAKNSIWDDAANATYERGDKSDLSKAGYEAILSHYDDIVAKSKDSGGDGTSITAEGLFDYAASTNDVAAQRSLILLMTNPDLLNQLDGSDHNGLISRGDIDTHKNGLQGDTDKTKANDASFKTEMGLVGNDSAIGFMDRFEAFTGANGGNGLVGKNGMHALAALSDNKYKAIFDAVPGSTDYTNAVHQFNQDMQADGSLPKDLADSDVDALFRGGDFKDKGGHYDGLLKDGSNAAHSYVNSAGHIWNGMPGLPETGPDGEDSFRKRFEAKLHDNTWIQKSDFSW